MMRRTPPDIEIAALRAAQAKAEADCALADRARLLRELGHRLGMDIDRLTQEMIDSFARSGR